MDTKILCIRNNESWNYGFFPLAPGYHQDYYKELESNRVAVPRSLAETDERYKQLIPYVMITGTTGDGSLYILVAESLKGSTETRLHHRVAAGFGGHVNDQEGVPVEELLLSTAARELKEELGVDVDPQRELRLVGMINADVDDVGRVHTGIVYRLEVNLNDLTWTRLRSAEPSKLRAFWSTPYFMAALEDRMDEWAKLALMGLALTPES